MVCYHFFFSFLLCLLFFFFILFLFIFIFLFLLSLFSNSSFFIFCQFLLLKIMQGACGHEVEIEVLKRRLASYKTFINKLKSSLSEGQATSLWDPELGKSLSFFLFLSAQFGFVQIKL